MIIQNKIIKLLANNYYKTFEVKTNEKLKEL